MREIFTSGSVGGLVEQSPILPGHAERRLVCGFQMVRSPIAAG